MIDISVIIINYNTAALVKKCIESVLMQRNVNFEIIVVDNNSSDNSIAVLREFGPKIALLTNRDNRGFGRANNQAYNLSKGRYLFMLNPDAVCLSNLDLYRLAQFMDDAPQYGLIGTRIVDSNNEVQTTAFDHYPRQEQTTADFSQLPGNLASVLGASMVARRDVFTVLKGFDEDYFLYAEETDLCLRIRKHGYKIGYCEKVTVQHEGGASEKDNPSADVVRRKKSAKYLFYTKHYSRADVIKIAKQDIKNARLHLFTLKIKKKLIGLSVRQEARYARHQVTCEIAQAYLNRN